MAADEGAPSTHDVELRPWLPIVVAAAVGAFAIFAVAILFTWDATSCPKARLVFPEGGKAGVPACQAFVSTPQFLVWLLLLWGQVAFWLLALIPVWRIVSEQYHRLAAPRRTTAVLVASTLLLLIVAGLASAPFDFPWPHSHLPWAKVDSFTRDSREGVLPGSWRLGVLTVLGGCVAGLAIVGIWFVTLALKRMARRARPTASDLKRFLELRSQLNLLLMIVGSMIGLATLAKGALRNAVLTLNTPSTTTFTFKFDHAELTLNTPSTTLFQLDAQYILLYGLVFSGVLAVAYLPAYMAIHEAGGRFREGAYRLPAPTDPRFGEVLSKRKTLDEFTQVSLSANASFKAGVAIATPLASSLLALLIPKF